MTDFRPKRCHECGVGKIRLLATPGRVARYRTIPNLEVPATFAIPTCDNCGAQWADEKNASALDSLLEDRFRVELRHRVRMAIEMLVSTCSQRELERTLGLSHGYISKLRAGDRDPSPDLVGLLTLLAAEPSRIEELRSMWKSSEATAIIPAQTDGISEHISKYVWSGGGAPSDIWPQKTPGRVPVARTTAPPVREAA
jgi:hypothetical protein